MMCFLNRVANQPTEASPTSPATTQAVTVETTRAMPNEVSAMTPDSKNHKAVHARASEVSLVSLASSLMSWDSFSTLCTAS